MRDSKLIQAVEDISAIARAKLGDDWQAILLPALLDSMGFTVTLARQFDGEMVEFSATKIETMVKNVETSQTGGD